MLFSQMLTSVNRASLGNYRSIAGIANFCSGSTLGLQAFFWWVRLQTRHMEDHIISADSAKTIILRYFAIAVLCLLTGLALMNKMKWASQFEAVATVVKLYGIALLSFFALMGDPFSAAIAAIIAADILFSLWWLWNSWRLASRIKTT